MMKGKTGLSLLANAAEAILISVFKRLIGRQLPIYCPSFPSFYQNCIHRKETEKQMDQYLSKRTYKNQQCIHQIQDFIHLS